MITSLIYRADGCMGQFVSLNSIGYTIIEMRCTIGGSAICGYTKDSTGICGKFSFNLILN